MFPLKGYKDKSIKFEYEPVVNKERFPLMQIGAGEPLAIEVLPSSINISQCITVHKTSGGDYTTVYAAMAATTANKPYVCILDSARYDEGDLRGLIAVLTYFQGVYCDTGQTPTINMRGIDDFGIVPTDANSVYVDKDGSDSATISAPVLFHNAATRSVAVIQQASGKIFISYVDDDDAKGKYVVLNSNLTSYAGETVFHDAGTSSVSVCEHVVGGVVLITFVDDDNSSKGTYLPLDATTYAPAAGGIFNNQTTSGTSAHVNNGDYLICYIDATGLGQFCVLAAGTYAKSTGAQPFHNATTANVAGVGSSEIVFVAYTDTADGDKGKFMAFNAWEYAELKAETIFNDGETTNIAVCLTSDGNYFITCSDGTDSDKGKFAIIDDAYNIICVGSIFLDSPCGYTGAFELTSGTQDGHIIIVYYDDDGTGDKGNYIILSDYLRGTRISPYLSIDYAITQLTATRNMICITDSETYTATGFEFSTANNFIALIGDNGCCPTVEITRNYDFFTLPADVTLENGSYVLTKIAYRQNGNMVVGRVSGTTMSISEYNTSGTCVATNVNLLLAGITTLCDIAVLSDGRILVVYRANPTGGNDICAVIYKTDYTVDFTAASLGYGFTGGYSYPHIVELDNGNILIEYAGVFRIYSNQLVMLLNTSLYTGTVPFTQSLTVMNNGDILWHYIITASKFYQIITQELVDVVAKTSAPQLSSYQGLFQLANDDIILFNYATHHLSYTIYDSTMTEVKSITQLSDFAYDDNITFTDFIYDYNNDLIHAAIDHTTCNIYSISPTMYAIKNTDLAMIGNVFLTPADTEYLSKFIYSVAAIAIIYSDVYGCESSTENCDCYAVHGTDLTWLYAAKVHDNDIGVWSDNDPSIFHYCQGYRNNKGYAVHFDGSGADVSITDSDIFNNSGGIRLENNAGTEIIQDNIIHDNANYGIEAETAIVYLNCVNTDTNLNATAGAGCTTANPLYINGGYTNEDDTDLNIKVKLLGYHWDSAAYGLSHTTGLNAGSLSCVYIGPAVSWSNCTVPKPDKIKSYVEHVEPINVQKRDGSYSTLSDGRSEIVELTWSTAIIANHTLFKALWFAVSDQVRIYPDPITSSSDYILYSIIRDKLSTSTPDYRQNESGVDDITLKFARKVTS